MAIVKLQTGARWPRWNSTRLGSAAVTAMAMARGGEKSNLLYEGFPKVGDSLTVVLVCFD